MKTLLTAGLFSIILLGLTACGGGATGVTPEALVPDDANLIAQVQVSRLVNDVDLENLYNQTPKDTGAPQSFDQALDLVLKETGMDIRQFNTATLFGDVAREGDYFGLIADGVFDESQVIGVIEQKMGTALSSLNYKGHEILYDDGGNDDIALAFPDSETLVIGTLEAVQAVVDVRTGDRNAASGQVADTFNTLDPGLIRLAVQVPPDAFDEMDSGFGPGFGGMPVAVEAFRDLDVVGVTADKNGDTLKLQAQLDFVSADSASQVGQTVEDMLGLVGALSPDPKLTALMENLEINVDGTKLALTFEAQLSDLEDLANSLDNMARVAP